MVLKLCRKVVFKIFLFDLFLGLCVGDFRLIVIDSIGCGIMLFCCIDYENEDLDFIL